MEKGKHGDVFLMEKKVKKNQILYMCCSVLYGLYAICWEAKKSK